MSDAKFKADLNNLTYIRKSIEKDPVFAKYNSRYQYYLKRYQIAPSSMKGEFNMYDVKGNLEKFRLNKPNYFIFVEHNMAAYRKQEKLTSEDNELPQPSLIENMFIATMRGILDSLYREFVYYRKVD